MDNYESCNLGCSRCKNIPYPVEKTNKKTYYIDLMSPGPLCGYDVCPKPITLPSVNYSKDEQRSAYDNHYRYYNSK